MHSAALPRFPGGKPNGRGLAHARSPGWAGSLTGVSGGRGAWEWGDGASILDRSSRFAQLRSVSGVVSWPLSEHPRYKATYPDALRRLFWRGRVGRGAGRGQVVHWPNTSHRAVRVWLRPRDRVCGQRLGPECEQQRARLSGAQAPATPFPRTSTMLNSTSAKRLRAASGEFHAGLGRARPPQNNMSGRVRCRWGAAPVHVAGSGVDGWLAGSGGGVAGCGLPSGHACDHDQ
jgi:hypothetical protein